MKKNDTQIIELDVEHLIPADWNYKYKGTEEEISKLSKSISKDGSAGVFAVREVQKDGKTFFEVMDGNHRLEAVRLLDWKKVPVENFGTITQAQAVTIARRRNHKWFDDDKLQLSKLMANVVIPELGKNELVEYMPDSLEDLENFENMAKFDWSEPTVNSGSGGEQQEQTKTIQIKVGEEVFNLWNKWLERCKGVIGLENEARAFEFAVIEALNVPEEKLKK